jgi:ssDNA-binding Zn-finger/Zn-ribbon topoisomerase 1
MEFEQREVRLRSGTCPSCSKEFAFLEGSTVSTRLGSPPEGAPSTGDESAEEEKEEALASGLECEECGSPLALETGARGSIVVSCPECETSTTFVPQGQERPPPRGRPEFRGSDTEAPRARPCRKCGSPLRFSTGEDGVVVGECDSCGNRFTLPPRGERSGGGRGYGGGRRYDRRGFRPGGGGGRYSDRGGDRRNRPYRPRGGPGRDSAEDPDRRDRRRRRRDE